MPKTERKAKARIDRRMKNELSEMGREWDAQLRQSLDGSTVDDAPTPPDDGGAGNPEVEASA